MAVDGFLPPPPGIIRLNLKYNPIERVSNNENAFQLKNKLERL